MSAQTTVSDWRLEDLSEAEREVYAAVELQGLRCSTVADRTGREASTVRTLLSRARKKRGNS